MPTGKIIKGVKRENRKCGFQNKETRSFCEINAKCLDIEGKREEKFISKLTVLDNIIIFIQLEFFFFCLSLYIICSTNRTKAIVVKYFTHTNI